MRKILFALLHTFMFTALVSVLSLCLMGCEPYNDESGEENGSYVSTSKIVVTGLVDTFGCGYADISGYANLNFLPAGSGNPVIGMELVEADTENKDDVLQVTSSSLTGNIYMVSFTSLTPATQYKYRSYVTYGGTTYYGEYRTFMTKELGNLIVTGEVSDVTRNYAVVISPVQTEGVDAKERINVGVAWSASKDAVCAGGGFESRQCSIHDVENGEFVVSLDNLSEGTTYYYASFTEVNGAYLFSSVKKFETKVLQLETGAVDLGLSVKWADCNVGASSPEEYGGYYAWGETEEKSNYYTYLYEGVYIGSNISGTEYDVAHVQLGDGWRMPTRDEVMELVNNCDWEWTFINGVNGCLVTGTTGYSIFLPAAGCRLGTDVIACGSEGYYWSGSEGEYSDDCAYYFYIGSGNHDFSLSYRYYGHTVRPVVEK